MTQERHPPKSKLETVKTDRVNMSPRSEAELKQIRQLLFGTDLSRLKLDLDALQAELRSKIEYLDNVIREQNEHLAAISSALQAQVDSSDASLNSVRSELSTLEEMTRADLGDLKQSTQSALLELKNSTGSEVSELDAKTSAKLSSLERSVFDKLALEKGAVLNFVEEHHESMLNHSKQQSDQREAGRRRLASLFTEISTILQEDDSVT